MKKPSAGYRKLKEKWKSRHNELSREIFDKHGRTFEWLSDNSRQLAIGSLAGFFLLTQPIAVKIPTTLSTPSAQALRITDKKVFLVYDLRSVLPDNVQPLTIEQQKQVSDILSRDFGISVAPEISGIRLNSVYGLIGQEQHLSRYPGDNMFTHFQDSQSANDYWQFGMAPGLGGWGYFASSKYNLTQKDIDREKYYIAVQTFLAPGFYNNPQKYLEFFKYRKMLVVNPQNGRAVVADIADAGPAPWTGKQLGGSPEVMSYLQRSDGAQVGGVLYFFIDDPNDTIPLGPLNPL